MVWLQMHAKNLNMHAHDCTKKAIKHTHIYAPTKVNTGCALLTHTKQT